jgi:hypothetical protein
MELDDLDRFAIFVSAMFSSFLSFLILIFFSLIFCAISRLMATRVSLPLDLDAGHGGNDGALAAYHKAHVLQVLFHLRAAAYLADDVFRAAVGIDERHHTASSLFLLD